MKKLIYAMVLSSSMGIAPAQPVSILDVEVDNGVFYTYDTADFSKFATVGDGVPVWAPSPGGSARNFLNGVYVADIVTVNGKPARGVMVRRGTSIQLRPSPVPGQAVSDVSRSFIDDGVWEFQQADGTPIGTVTTHGFIGGPAPPGAPAAASGTNVAVTGGTGAYLGARGQLVGAPVTGTAGLRPLMASITEDPANRRANGGNRSRFLLHLIPLSPPELLDTVGAAAIVHASDGLAVTAANPASRGETLMLYARGLGPANTGADPGQPFPRSPTPLVNSPVDVTINTVRAEVQAAAGYPGSTDVYQVKFVVPDGIPAGTARLQLNVAWMGANPAEIAVK
jgi:uncharacterized protein (TIGR03437 family)